jgi:hypothetical protein
MRKRAIGLLLFLATIFFMAACNRSTASEEATIKPTTAILIAEATTAPTVAVQPTATAASLAIPTRVGSEYVLRLPREAAVPADWVMSPQPAFETRDPQPGDTYHFACVDLPARSIGAASVGYRHLEGLPSIHVEYVVYRSAEDAAAALEEMRQATAACPSFVIGQGEGAIDAVLAPLDFPPYGDASFAAALTTDAPATGELLTHAVKILSGRIVVGINHAVYAAESPPDAALTESLAALAVANLAAPP